MALAGPESMAGPVGRAVAAVLAAVAVLAETVVWAVAAEMAAAVRRGWLFSAPHHLMLILAGLWLPMEMVTRPRTDSVLLPMFRERLRP